LAPGDEQVFNVSGPTAGDIRYVWVVRKYNDNNEIIETKTVPSHQMEYTLIATSDDYHNLYTEVEVQLQKIVTIGDFQLWRTKDIKEWEVKVNDEQVAPEWTGSILLRNENDVTQLEGFSSITGNVVIDDTDFESTNALTDILSISGSLLVQENKKLVDLKGLNLSSQFTVENSVIIVDNAKLLTTKGLESLTSLGGSLYLNKNPRLENLLGFKNIENIGEKLTIGSYDNSDIGGSGNAALKSLSGLNRLTSVGSLIIEVNPSLASLEGANSLKNISDTLLIYNNKNLINLNGLETVTSVGTLVVTKNPLLQNLGGLDSLENLNNIDLRNNEVE